MVKPFCFPPPKAATLAMLVLLVSACAGPRSATPGGDGARTPARPPNCALTVSAGPTPAAPAWDDLGTAEVTCHLDVGFAQCLRRFRAEACRMGGDLVYAMPGEPLRPREYSIMYRGKVAHTRAPVHVPIVPE